MVPSVYEDGTLYNVLPSGNKAPDETGNHNGYDQTRADFTFSRGSNLAATRVNANGLIEKGRENLLLQSNQFDTTWLNSNSNETSGYSGYDGSNDAWLLTKSAANGMIYQSITSSGVQTLSVYAKEGTNSWMQIYAVGSTNVRAYYNLSNGTLGAYALNVIDRNIEDIGSGWYRCSVTFNSSLTSIRFFVSDGNNNDGGTSGSIYIQNAQLEYGLAASSYLDSGATTATAGVLENTPRIDYSSGAGALLLESQRTNTISKSEYISSYSSGGGAGLTMTANYGISPEGVKNSTRIQYTSGNSYVYSNYATATASGQSFTISIYAKGVAGEQIRLHASGSSGISFNKEFTLSGEWQRFDATGTTGSAGQVLPHILVGYGSSNPATDFEVYGWQCEQASHVSSYVPTYGSAATRGAESGVSDVDSLLTSNATYTWFVEFIVPESGIGGGEITFKDAGGSSQLRIYCNQNNTIGLRVEDGGQTHFINVSVGDTAKCLFQCSNGLVKGFYNGSLVHTFTVDTGMDAQKIHLGPPISAPDVKEVLLFNEALSDAECVTLTTL